jgi:hypothetical protein
MRTLNLYKIKEINATAQERAVANFMHFLGNRLYDRLDIEFRPYLEDNRIIEKEVSQYYKDTSVYKAYLKDDNKSVIIIAQPHKVQFPLHHNIPIDKITRDYELSIFPDGEEQNGSALFKVKYNELPEDRSAGTLFEGTVSEEIQQLDNLQVEGQKIVDKLVLFLEQIIANFNWSWFAETEEVEFTFEGELIKVVNKQ